MPPMGLTLVAASQFAAAGGLVLGVYNLWNGWKKPVNDEQRTLRGELLELLQDMHIELSSGLSRVTAKEVYYAPNPIPRLPDNLARVNRLSGRLISPGSHSMHLLDLAVGSAIRDWRAIEWHYRNETESSPTFHITLDKLVGTANQGFTRADQRVGTFIVKVNKINKGNWFVYRSMKGKNARV